MRNENKTRVCRRFGATPMGFTLVELLVTLSIMATLFALLFPALQIAREVARRTYCANNLRQFAMGMLSHHDSAGEFLGWRNAIENYSEAQKSKNIEEALVSWTVALMPQIEELPTYDWYTNYGADDANDNATDPRENRLKIFSCPSQDWSRDDTPRLGYAANGGTGGEFLDNTGRVKRQYASDGALVDMVGNQSSSGFYFAARPSYTPQKQTFSSLTDGTSYTLLFTERSGPFVPSRVNWSGHPRPAKPYRGAVVSNHVVLHPLPAGDTERRDTFYINPKPEQFVDGWAGHFVPSSPPSEVNVDDWPLRYPSSYHCMLVNMAFFDGHVEKIHEELDPWVYCQLLSSGSSVSDHVRDWQRYYDDNDELQPYQFNENDLK
jgi:prepilin-type N-terminal cleavage/methylation domain-containing protein/prepilin-type processing-associated H-X9-DG protein